MLTLRTQFYVDAPEHKHLVTQVFDRESKYLDDDSVFAVKDNLIIDFLPITEASAPLPAGGEFDEKIQWEVKYDISLAAASAVDTSAFQG